MYIKAEQVQAAVRTASDIILRVTRCTHNVITEQRRLSHLAGHAKKARTRKKNRRRLVGLIREELSHGES